MSNKRVKVIGYAKSEVYGNGIEYRNFSDDLVGNQFTSDGGSALFTLGNFKVTTNLEDRLRRSFNTGPFSKYYSLNKLKLDDDIVLLGYKDSKMMKLNLDKANLSNYAYFGSLKEFIRVSLEQIIMKWPASLYVTKVNQINPTNDNLTFENYSFNELTNRATFNVNVGYVKNDFDINIKKDGTTLNTFNQDNKLRDLNISFSDYVIFVGGQEYPITKYTGYSNANSMIMFEVIGDPFGESGNINYHIKPKQGKLNKFFFELDSFGSHLLNRNSTPKYKANFNFTFESENGANILGSKTVTWPVSDGYNIDFKSPEYSLFVSDLLDIAENNDDTRSNILTNRLVSKSILEFDTVESKMDKTLKIYGRNMDEIKTYIDSIKFINHISYNKKNNIPDRLVKNLARTMGWELTTSLFNIDFNDDFLSSKGSLNLSPVESEIEFWRRLILNSPWIWKSKGTRKVIEFLLHFVGTPKGLVSFNEYVYKASNSIDVEEVEQIYLSLGMDFTNNKIIDNDGFPRVPKNTKNMYFQKGGGWYRQTSGENSNLDSNKGNNPHEGPYDFGYAYVNQYNEIVPNFEPVILSTNRVSSTNEQIFLNYDNGKFDKFLTTGQVVNDAINSYIQILTTSNVAVDSSLIQVTDQIVKSPKPKAESEDDAYEVGSYKVSISRKTPDYSNPCNYTSFSLDGNGLVLFTHADGSQDYNMTSECCSGLSFTPELNDNNQYVCRWKTLITDACNNYTITDNFHSSYGYAVFINNETGALTDLVPTEECCTNEGLVYTNEGDMFHCIKEVVIEEPTCDDYVFTGNYSDQYAIFQYGESNTTTVLSVDCCSVNDLESTTVNGEIKCIESVPNCESYVIHKIPQDGAIQFIDVDSIITDTVHSTECCEYHGFVGTDVDGKIKCFEKKDEIIEPVLNLVTRNGDGYEEIMTMEIIGVPNTIVKYRVTVMIAGDHGFTNSLTNLATGENVTPANPTPFVGSYCEGSITLGDSGRVEVDMATTARPPLRNLSNNCSSLEFSIMDYDYVTINGNNRLLNEACYPI